MDKNKEQLTNQHSGTDISWIIQYSQKKKSTWNKLILNQRLNKYKGINYMTANVLPNLL